MANLSTRRIQHVLVTFSTTRSSSSTPCRPRTMANTHVGVVMGISILLLSLFSLSNQVSRGFYWLLFFLLKIYLLSIKDIFKNCFIYLDVIYINVICLSHMLCFPYHKKIYFCMILTSIKLYFIQFRHMSVHILIQLNSISPVLIHFLPYIFRCQIIVKVIDKFINIRGFPVYRTFF